MSTDSHYLNKSNLNRINLQIGLLLRHILVFKGFRVRFPVGLLGFRTTLTLIKRFNSYARFVNSFRKCLWRRLNKTRKTQYLRVNTSLTHSLKRFNFNITYKDDILCM